MVGLWAHPPGTLRALIATFGRHYVVCRPCRRYTPIRIEERHLDRKFHPWPFRCDTPFAPVCPGGAVAKTIAFASMASVSVRHVEIRARYVGAWQCSFPLGWLA